MRFRPSSVGRYIEEMPSGMWLGLDGLGGLAIPILLEGHANAIPAAVGGISGVALCPRRTVAKRR
jgi:hypothetical protein